MNVQPLHIDAHYAAKSEWGKPLVNSLFTLGLLIGMTVNDTTSRHHTRQPRHDRRAVSEAAVSRAISVKVRTIGAAPSARANRVRTKASSTSIHEMTNQNGDVVAICERAAH